MKYDLARNWKHGHTEGHNNSSEYNAWLGMRRRCLDPINSKYKDYGGRGIKICDRWLTFINFFEDMGYKTTTKHTLGRINNDGDYDPLNCEWQTRKQQQHNTRRTSNMTMAKAREVRMLFNRGYSCRELAEEFGVTRHVIKHITAGRSWL